MPGMDGYALVRNLRSAPRTRLVPIVFLTAKDETADRIAGFRTGVDAYLTKPFESEELVAVVASILDRVQRTHSDLARMFGEQEADEYELVRDEDLTEAEWRVAEAVARGLSNKEIAAELNLSLQDGGGPHQPHPRQEEPEQPRGAGPPRARAQAARVKPPRPRLILNRTHADASLRWPWKSRALIAIQGPGRMPAFSILCPHPRPGVLSPVSYPLSQNYPG